MITNVIVCRPMRNGEENALSELARESFLDAVAPHYTDDGVEEFLRYSSAEAINQRYHKGNAFFVCESVGELAAMMEIREDHHIAMLFVRPGMQRQGIGRRLAQESIAYCRTPNLETRQITVNSSPNSVAAYERLGFHKTGEQQETNGIRFIPMALNMP